ncbi:hypothetical protein TcasGA2_TC014669 [Tribolium castaneum]|uniref:Uncharacterized protein n=1 Tax=Tribolium castaneum TaxID=7070 RepID=D6WNI1_TRICA|nr:hypothetical protein TcasGA2_TC014669 [Tribolium castaneum]
MVAVCNPSSGGKLSIIGSREILAQEKIPVMGIEYQKESGKMIFLGSVTPNASFVIVLDHDRLENLCGIRGFPDIGPRFTIGEIRKKFNVLLGKQLLGG